MAATPPPLGRVHTPPAPIHGVQHDSYEPYSPRRSSRVASQRGTQTDAQRSSASPSAKRQATRSARATTPVARPPSSQTFSPPSSPNSPISRLSSTKKRASTSGHGRSLHDHFEMNPQLGPSARPTSGVNPLAALGMLPTPSKTPRKRPVQAQAALAGTARVLFSDRPATVDDAMPEPRKGRKGKKNAFSLASFEELDEDDSSSKIEIYTDSKERLPEADETDDNPFLTRRAKAEPVKRRKPKDQKTLDMERAVHNDEGLVFTFRGKKVFRKFESSADEDDDSPNMDELDVRRRAGVSQRLTRSSIKPRLLFPSEEQRLAREAAANAVDEEAVTDIETPKTGGADAMDVEDQDAAVTQVKQQQFETLPSPSSARPSRSKGKKSSRDPEVPVSVPPLDEDGIPHIMPKKAGSFDSWRRTKAGASTVSKGTKRGGDPINGEASKRTRSMAAATSNSQ